MDKNLLEGQEAHVSIDSACDREDLTSAFTAETRRLDSRRFELWSDYMERIRSVPASQYHLHEQECWQVLEAGLAGITAEQNLLSQRFQQQLRRFERAGAVV